MALSKKNYVAIAKIISGERDNWEGEPQVQLALSYLSSALAGYFAADNQAFDRDKFLAAARVEGAK